MKRTYHIFDCDPIDFDDERTVRELIEKAFEENDYFEPAGMDIVTLYDAAQYKVVIDTDVPCKDAIRPYGYRDNFNGLCFAYLKPHWFFYAEGGWGHHMIDMNAARYVDNPMAVKFVFEDFRHTVVVNGNATPKAIYDYLFKTSYIPVYDRYFRFVEYGHGGFEYEDPETVVDVDKDRDRDKPIREIAGKMVSPVCMIRSRA